MTTLDERFRKVITPQRLAIAMAAICIFIFFRPLFLPMRIGFQTQDFYNRIEAIKPGDVVVYSTDTDSGGLLGGRRDIYILLVNDLVAKGAKILFHPTYAGWSSATEPFTRLTNLRNKVYGVDYVYLPYVAGEEMAWAAFAADVHGFYKTDVYNTALSALPMMNNIRTMADVDLCVVQYGIFTWGEMFMRQWPAKYGVDMICLALFSTLQAWYGTYVKGNLDLDLGFAEYESLRKVAAEHILRMEVRNTISTIIIALVIIASATYWIAKPSKEEQKARTSMGV